MHQFKVPRANVSVIFEQIREFLMIDILLLYQVLGDPCLAIIRCSFYTNSRINTFFITVRLHKKTPFLASLYSSMPVPIILITEVPAIFLHIR